MDKDAALRKQLSTFLTEREAHMSLIDAVKDFPETHINSSPPHVEYTFWHLLEHIRITQWDIVNFIKNPNYEELKWPDNYWPEKNKKASLKDWKHTIATFESDLKDMVNIIQSPQTDLYAKIPHGQGQTILREALLIIDHNSYHLGEFAILRRVENNWKKS